MSLFVTREGGRGALRVNSCISSFLEHLRDFMCPTRNKNLKLLHAGTTTIASSTIAPSCISATLIKKPGKVASGKSELQCDVHATNEPFYLAPTIASSTDTKFYHAWTVSVLYPARRGCSL